MLTHSEAKSHWSINKWPTVYERSSLPRPQEPTRINTATGRDQHVTTTVNFARYLPQFAQRN
jgi:hypothetical protein